MLVHKSHDLLQEEIVVTVYNMASVDFEKFYSEFLPQFLTGCEGIDDTQKNMLGQNFKIDEVEWIFLYTWVKVFRIIPEFRILRLTFHRKSASKC